MAVGQPLGNERFVDAKFPDNVAAGVAFRDAIGVVFGCQQPVAFEHLRVQGIREALELKANRFLCIQFEHASGVE